MIGIDTNVLVRYLVRHDSEQASRATRFITNDCSPDEPGFINRFVLCEFVSVLETAHGYARDSVAVALEKILRTAQFRIEDQQEAWASFRAYQEGADFSDSLIPGVNRRLGCQRTVTFDRKAAHDRGSRAFSPVSVLAGLSLARRMR
jgi:predicted nucleic-acid-binding protein